MSSIRYPVCKWGQAALSNLLQVQRMADRRSPQSRDRTYLQDVLIKTSKGNKSDLRSDKRCHKLWVTPGVACWSGQDADNVCLWRTQVVVICKGMATTHQELVWHSSVVETCVLSSRKPPHTEVLRVPFFTRAKAQTLPGTTAPHWHLCFSQHS